jgi:tetratricopeptide (TPR) repeat protein
VAIRSGLAVAAATIGILGLGVVTPAAAQGACTGGGKISKQIAKPMSAAQDALKARKWQEILNRTREAESTPGAKSQFDQYWMYEFRGYAYHNLHQPAEAARELEAALNSPCMPEANKLERYKSLAGLYSSLRNYQKVIDYGNRALKVARDPDMQVQVAQAYYQTGNNKDAVRVHERDACQHRAEWQGAEGTTAAVDRGGLPEGWRQQLRQQGLREAGAALPEARVLAEPHGGDQGRPTPTTSRVSTSCGSRPT